MIRVLICDDDPQARVTLERWLKHQPDIEIAGQAADGEDALALATSIPADVIVLDVWMPKRDGISVAHAMRDQGVQTPVVMLSADDTTAARARRVAGTRFLSKGTAGPREILTAVRDAATGRAPGQERGKHTPN
ncbi:MAG TPA: response regulator transcription factor [Actinomycetota bacterium]